MLKFVLLVFAGILVPGYKACLLDGLVAECESLGDIGLNDPGDNQIREVYWKSHEYPDLVVLKTRFVGLKVSK
jgi:hypothetical protein